MTQGFDVRLSDGSTVAIPEPHPAASRVPIREAGAVEDLLRQILAALQAQQGGVSSVEIERNSRGANVRVKAYHASLDQAAADARRVYDELSATYGGTQP